MKIVKSRLVSYYLVKVLYILPRNVISLLHNSNACVKWHSFYIIRVFISFDKFKEQNFSL